MAVIYLFMVYKNADFVYHICQRLSAPNVYFHFHVDSKSEEDFSRLRDLKNISFSSKRFSAEWAGPGIIYAIVHCMAEISARFTNGHVVLMSESDYPVKTADYITSYLSNYPSKDFIKITPLPAKNPLDTPNSNWLEGGMRKINCYALRLTPRMIATIEPRNYNWGNARQFLKVLLYKPSKIKEALELFKKERRKHPQGITYSGGDLWFVLRISTIEAVLDWIKKNPSILDEAKWAESIDEIFFQSIVGFIIPKGEIVHSTLRYVNWPMKRLSSPEFLTMNNSDLLLTQIKNPNILFVRKVCDEQVTKYIDSIIDAK